MGRACIKTHIITNQPHKAFNINDMVFELYPGMLQVRDKTNHVKYPCRPTVKTRGKIKGFSKKSRSGFIKFFAKIEQMIDWWFDLTFHDQTLKAFQTVEDRARFASEVLRQFLQWLRRNYPDMWFAWKREWMSRLSGIMEGELNPHFHVYAGGEKLSQDDIFNIMRKWVELTGVQGDYKVEALKVALNHKSYRKINNAYEAQAYATKYGTKISEASGRAWGKVGNIPIAKPKVLNFTVEQMVALYRILRGLLKSKQKKKNKFKYSIGKRLKKLNFQGFFLIPMIEIVRIINFITGGNDNEQERIYGIVQGSI